MVEGKRCSQHLLLMKGEKRMFLIPLALLAVEILFAIFFIFTLILQFLLSGLKRSWPGFILPGISFALALLISGGSAWGAWVWDYFFPVLLFLNIPTALYLLIYFLRRFLRRKKQRQ